MQFGVIDLGQHWLKYALFPDGTKPLPQPMLVSAQATSLYNEVDNYSL